jgi:uncharacterized membrane protein
VRGYDVNTILGTVLRTGVVLAVVIVTIGSILLFVEGTTGYGPVQNSETMVVQRNRFLLGLVPVLQGVAAGRPYAILDLGLLILLATPVARVAISIPLFWIERRYVFVVVTGIVLAILLFSMLVVAPYVSTTLGLEAPS